MLHNVYLWMSFLANRALIIINLCIWQNFRSLRELSFADYSVTGPMTFRHNWWLLLTVTLRVPSMMTMSFGDILDCSFVRLK